MRTPNFWPLDDDPEDPIYDSPAWDLPGHRKTARIPWRARTAGNERDKKVP
jgi:hypothetical protein